MSIYTSEFISLLTKDSPPGTSFQILTKPSGSIQVQIIRNMSLQKKRKVTAYRVSKIVTVTVKELSSFSQTELADFVFARVLNAVYDLPLLPSSDFEIQIEEYLLLQEQVLAIRTSHWPAKCQGMQFHRLCEYCMKEHHDAAFGSTLKYKLEALDAIAEVIDDDDGFDPTEYDPTQDNFLQMVEHAASRGDLLS